MKDFPSSFFVVQKIPENVVFDASKVYEMNFNPSKEGELVSLSLGFCQITCDKRCYQVVAEWKETFMEFICAAFHISRFSGVFGSKAVSPLVCQSFSIFLGLFRKIGGHRKLSIQADLKRRTVKNLPIH